LQNKEKSHKKVAKIDDFNEFRSFCALVMLAFIANFVTLHHSFDVWI